MTDLELAGLKRVAKHAVKKGLVSKRHSLPKGKT